MKKVAVVILNFKVKEHVLKCIDSVKKSTYRNIKIILVDNNSGDGIEDEIKQNGNLEFIQTKDNLGYTGGNNIGIKRALEEKSDLIFLLNPDTILSERAIEILVGNMIIEDVGIAGPKIYFFPTGETKKYGMQEGYLKGLM
ncbi:glycosyltransferase [Candidatus Daviesbacteria bacterium]|nr:glycosyltransferase [Candidatus Daviesbacteria bacterium]